MPNDKINNSNENDAKIKVAEIALLKVIISAQQPTQIPISISENMDKDTRGRFMINISFIALGAVLQEIEKLNDRQMVNRITNFLKNQLLGSYSKNSNMPLDKWELMFNYTYSEIKNIIFNNTGSEYNNRIGLHLASISSLNQEYFSPEFIEECGQFGVSVWNTASRKCHQVLKMVHIIK